MAWPTYLPILLFLGLFVLDLRANTCQTTTDHVTLVITALPVMRFEVMKFEVQI